MNAIVELKNSINNAWISPVEPEIIKDIEKKLDVLNIVSDIIPYLIQPQTVMNYTTGEAVTKYLLAVNGAGRELSTEEIDKITEFSKEILKEQGKYNGMETAEVINVATKEQKNEKTSDERLTNKDTSDKMEA